MRFEVSERALGTLPAIDIAESRIVIGSAASARIRLPPEAARAEHVEVDGPTWRLLAEAKVGGMVRAAGDSGAIGHGLTIELGRYRVRISATPAGATPSPPRRTESLARELVRGLLGEGAAPSLEIERGPGAGARRLLPPPEARLVLGRGDEATWVILDEDLSRVHAEIRRGWDGTTVADLGSKNGTRIDGVAIGAEPVELRDGAALLLGNVTIRFRDPAERHLRGEIGAPSAPPARRARTAPPPAPRRPSLVPFVAFTTVAVLALLAALWILVS
jgi:hypothetical protein